jgi:ubiquinol-cytochrome c reductase iron-sulfur subunit
VIDRLIALVVLLLSLGKKRRRAPKPRIVAEAPPEPRAELVVLALLILATLSAAAFVPIYALDSLHRMQTQLFGLSLGLAFLFLAFACIVFAKRLVPQEGIADPYPAPEHVHEQERVEEIADESGDRLTRRRLLKVAAGGAGTALGVALLTPAASLGPVLDVAQLRRTPWRRGVRLVDSLGRPLRADGIDEKSFLTAFPEGADPEDVGSPLVVVRVDPERLQLPADRDGWAPDGLLAYSKICTHAGCAVSMYRTPTFEPTSARPALVCPCHYSTFDPARGGKVLFGPAGRNLPQLPLEIDASGGLRAAGDFSGPIGPSWWGVRWGSQHG